MNIGWLKSVRERLRGGAREVDVEARQGEARARLESHPWPAAALSVLERLRAGGGQAYFVGGTVRDALLGREGHAVFDVATDVEPDEVVRRFPRVEPTGIRHGTVLIVTDGIQAECTTFRRE